MTCIVGVRHQGGVVLAGDSVGSDGNRSIHRRDKKTFNLSPEIALGFTTSYRMGQILRWHVDLDPLTGSMHRYGDLWDWVGKMFLPAAKAAMAGHGFEQDRSGRKEGGTFLLAVRDRLFQIYDDYQVAETEEMFDATGSGESVALGSLYCRTRGLGIADNAEAARGAARQAIEAAAHLTPYVGGTITYAETTSSST